MQTVLQKPFYKPLVDTESYLKQLEPVVNETQLGDFCKSLCHELGMDFYNYGIQLSSSFTRSSFKTLNNYHKRWNTEYYNNNYISSDPVLLHCLESVKPLIWESVTYLQEGGVRAYMMFAAYNNDLARGVSVPIHDAYGCKAIFSLTCKRKSAVDHSYLQQIAPYVTHLSTAIHQKMTELAGIKKKRSHENLTARELECLGWTADGKTAWEIASILKISERTANFHLHNAMHKLGAVNKPHAVAKAISWGVIRPALNFSAEPLVNDP